jgi:hypothetical protein
MTHITPLPVARKRTLAHTAAAHSLLTVQKHHGAHSSRTHLAHTEKGIHRTLCTLDCTSTPWRTQQPHTSSGAHREGHTPLTALLDCTLMISNSKGRTLTAHTGDNKWTAELAAKCVESSCAQRRSLKCKHCGATSSHVPDFTKLEFLENSVVEVKCRSCPQGGRKTGILYLCLDCGRFNLRKDKLTHDSDCGKEEGGGLITPPPPPMFVMML